MHTKEYQEAYRSGKRDTFTAGITVKEQLSLMWKIEDTDLLCFLLEGSIVYHHSLVDWYGNTIKPEDRIKIAHNMITPEYKKAYLNGERDEYTKGDHAVGFACVFDAWWT